MKTHFIPKKCETPPVQGGATRDQLPGWSHPFNSVDALRTQTLILAHSVRPEWAAMIAAFAFGGGAHG